jgi:hypothetical protein
VEVVVMAVGGEGGGQHDAGVVDEDVGAPSLAFTRSAAATRESLLVTSTRMAIARRARPQWPG